ncbi:DNRLRE domain-containing protein [Sphaerisporangium sp. NPDC051011]|uniref:DNRLRE domain-containing protein n=1 Tax=Sphaerisporangium sp. NPDC051011 TaxID=3155792 RepID=UPI0033CE8190
MLLASMAPAAPAYAQNTDASQEPGIVSRLTRWLSDGLTGLFTGDPKGEIRPGDGTIALPGRNGSPTPQKAKPPGKRVKELTGKRSAQRRVFELEDGRLQAEVSSTPMYYRDSAGKWQDIDTRIRAVAGEGFSLGNDRTGFSSRFGDSTGRLAEVRAGDRRLTLGVAGQARQVTPEVAGSTVTYRGVWDGVDVVYKLTSEGVKEYLVLSKPPAAGASYAFTVGTGGVSAQAQADGSIAFLPEGSDRPAFTIPKPFMIDSQADQTSPYGKKYSDAVTQAVTQRGGEATITLTPDAGWLAAPDRKWPVVIDPTVRIQPESEFESSDTYVNSAAKTTNYDSSWKLPVGKISATGINRALLYFNITNDEVPIGTVVDQARLETYFDQALGEAGPVTIEAHEITSPWESWTVNWNTQPTFSPTVASSVIRQPGEFSRWHSFDVTTMVNGWMSSIDAPMNGILLKAADEGSAGAIAGPVYEASQDLYGGDGMTGETVNMPKLVITYGNPGVVLKPVTTATATGAQLSWTPYVDPTPGDASDDIVEYQVHRECPSGCQIPATGGVVDTLVAPLAPDVTSYTDTTGGGDPEAVADPSYIHEATYWIVVKLANGRQVVSQSQRVILPRPGQVSKILYGSADTTLSSGEPSVAHDVVTGQKWLQVGNTATTLANTRAVVKFDDYAAQIPADAQISDATLSLWGVNTSGSGVTFNAHKLTRAFTEAATWAKSDGTTLWTTAGGDFDAAVLGSVSGVSAQPGWRKWTVTGAAKAWTTTPASNFGLLVKVANEAGTAKQSAQFLATEADGETVLRPRLRVTYAEKTSGSSSFYAPGTPDRLEVGATQTVTVAVTNTTTQTWPAASTALSYFWKLPDGTDVSTGSNQVKTMLPANLAPGETVAVTAQIKAPATLSNVGNKAEAVDLVWDVQDTSTNNWKSATHQLPQLPQQIRLDSPTSDLLGAEKFYSYTGKNTGAGSTALVNPYAGNVVWGYNAYSNPSRGAQTFVRTTYNSLDTSASSMGYGWSLQTSTLQRLGSQVYFHPPGQQWPTQVRLTDGDGTTHVWTLDTHGASVCTPAVCDYTHPRGVHLYLQRVADPNNPARVSPDPSRQWVFTKPDRTQFFFDDEGFQSAIVDNNGNTMSFTYERRKSNNKPTKFLQYITDAAGRRTLSLTYYKKGQDYTYIDDNTWNPVDDTKLTNPHIIDQVESVTDIAGRKVTFAYTVKGLMARMVDGAGDAQAKTFKFAYDATQGNKNVKLVKVTDPRGNATALKYYEAPVDPKDKWKIEDLTDRLSGVTHFDYVDPDGPQGGKIEATVTDPLQHATKYVLDAYGRPESITNAKTETTALQWDPDHNVTRLTEANGAYTTWNFDQKTGYPLEIKGAEANANGTAPTTLTYQSFLNGYVADLTGKRSPEGRSWQFGYDTAGNLKTVTDPLGVASPAAGDYTTGYDYDAFGQLVKSTDANGNATRYGGYHPTGYPQTIIDAYDNVTTTAYDVRGDVLSVTDALGKKTTQTYDIFKRPLENKVPKDQDAGVFITTPPPVYDANDNITQMTAPNGAVSTAVYDKADQLVESLLPKDAPNGPERKASFTYDLAGNLKTQTEPKGNLTPSDPADFVTSYVYDPIYQLTDVINAEQKKITYIYDNVGNVEKVVDPRKNATADTADYTAIYTYDRDHRVTHVKDAAGHQTITDYDLDGLVEGTTDQDGNKTLIGLDGRGDVVETKVPHSETGGVVKYTTIQFVYDQAGNRTKVITPRGVETTDDPTDFIAETKYDKLNRPSEQIYPFDRDDPVYNTPDSVKYAYDAVSRLREISAPPSHGQTVRNVTSMTYWDNGWSKTTTDPWDIKTSYDYNPLGEQTNRTVTSAGGSSQRALTWSYHPDGKLKAHADNGTPLGLDVVLGDNSDTGQVTFTGTWATTSAGSGYTGYDYATAPAGTGTSAAIWTLTTPRAGTYKAYVKYPSGAGATNAVYTVKYDGGQATATVDQTKNAGQWVELGSYTFAEGNAHTITLTDQANGTVAADSVKLVRDNSADTDTEKKDFEYSYDPNANLTQILDHSPNAKIDTWDISYTGLNQVSKILEKLDAVVKNTTTYDYNENSAVTKRTHDKTIATYGYDVRDLVDTVTNAKSATDPSPKTTRYTYTPRAERLTETKANGNTVTYDHFLDGLLQHSLEKKPNATVVSEHTINYQGNLNRSRDQAKLQNADNPGAYLEHVYDYTYDPRDRIAKTVKTPAGGGATETETYNHDAGSNVYDQTVKGVRTQFTFDRNRLMTSIAGSATSTYTYDPYGRLRQITGGGKALEKYTYDGFDHIIRHDKLNSDGATSTVTKYTYDPLDRTTSKTEKDGTAAAKTTLYSYLGLSGEVLDEEVAGKLTKSFQYSAWGERLSQVKVNADDTEESSYYGYNPHTDVEQVTKENGDTRATYGYTAYGTNDDKLFTGIDKPDPADPTAKDEYNPYRYNAKRWDNSTGMYDMGFRDYNPGLNRFLTLDSYNGALADLSLGTDPWTANRYTFTGGNPISNIELDGHRPEPGDMTAGEWGAWQRGGYDEYKAHRYKNGLMSWHEQYEYTYRRNGGNARSVIRDEGRLLGAAAVYDKQGKRLYFESGFFTGKVNKGMGESKSYETHLERRIVDWFEEKGLLKPGNTLVIFSNGSQGPCPGPKGCEAYLQQYAHENGVNIRWESNGKPAAFGSPNTGSDNLKASDIFDDEGRWKYLPKQPAITERGGSPYGGSHFGRVGGRMLGAFSFLSDLLWVFEAADIWTNPTKYCAAQYQSDWIYGTVPGCSGPML